MATFGKLSMPSNAYVARCIVHRCEYLSNAMATMLTLTFNYGMALRDLEDTMGARRRCRHGQGYDASE